MFFRKKLSPEKFWEWFNQHENEYYELKGDIEEKLQTLRDQLAKVHPDLACEFNYDLIGGKREFIISASGIIDAFPKVIHLIEVAALDEDRWLLRAFRQRLDIKEGDYEIQYEDIALKLEHLYFSYQTVEREGYKEVDLDIYVDSLTLREETIEACLILIDNLIGEYDAVTKLGNIYFYDYQDRRSGILPIKKLIEVVDAL